MDDFQKMVETKSKELRKLAATKRNEEWREEKRSEQSGPPGAGGFAKVGDAHWHKFYAGYEWVEDLMHNYTFFPNPKDAKGAISALKEVVGAGELSKGGGDAKFDDDNEISGGGKLGSDALARTDLIMALTASDWEGKGATAFRKLVSNLDPATRNQIALGKTIRELAIAHHDLMVSTRNDVTELLKDAETALEAHGNDSNGGFDIKTLITLSATAATLTVGGTTLKPIAAIVEGALDKDDDGKLEKGKNRLANIQGGMIMYGAIGGLNSFLDSNDEDKKEEPRLGADTVDGVLDNIRAAEAKIRTKLNDSTESLEKRCQKNINFILEHDQNELSEQHEYQDPMIIAPRPKPFVDAPRRKVGDTFRPKGTRIR